MQILIRNEIYYTESRASSTVAALMPPEGNTQFDLHMHESMHRLHELRSNFKTDIFVSVCCSNIPKGGQTNTQIDPEDIVKRIRKKGYNW